MTRDRLWIGILGIGLTLAVVVTLAPYGVVSGTAYSLLTVSAIVTLVVALRRLQLHRPLAWWLMAGAMVMAMAGDIIYDTFELRGLEPFPSIADVPYLASYPLFAAALWHLGKRHDSDLGSLLDAAIIAISAGVLSWVYLLAPYVEDPSLTLAERLVSIAYPIGDLALLPLIIRLVFAHAGRIPAHLLVLVGMAVYLVADVVFALGSLGGWYTSGGVNDALWLVAHIAFAAAAWHPSAVVEPPEVGVEVSLSSRRLAALAAASILAPVVVLLHDASDDYTVQVGAAASILLFLLVVQRMAGLMGQVHRQSSELERLSRTDPLTGAANRRHLDDALTRGLARAARTGGALSIALIDLDRFKAFNDTFGHQAGDDLLQAAVAAWNGELRELDLLARFGGEEFLVILPDCTRTEAEAVVERLRRRLPQGQTCSAGVAHALPGEPPASLIARADAALYAAKDGGRDRSVVAPPSGVMID